MLCSGDEKPLGRGELALRFLGELLAHLADDGAASRAGRVPTVAGVSFAIEEAGGDDLGR